MPLISQQLQKLKTWLDSKNVARAKELTLEQLLDETNNNERYLRFLITKLRSIRLIMGEKRNNKYFYYLSYESFTTYLKTKYSDAIYNLVKRGSNSNIQ